MQKLLRRSPTAPIFPSTGFKSCTKNRRFDFLSVYPPRPPPPPPLAMPASTAFRLQPSPSSAGSIPLRHRLHPASTAPSRVYSSNCRICRCSLSKGRVDRASVVLKEVRRSGSLSASCHTASDGGLKTSDESAILEDSLGVENGEKGEETCVEDGRRSQKVVSLGSDSGVEKPLRVNRRQKGSLSGVAMAAPPGNLDLLTIPGVGPRNLRKLVEKGIEEVAQLKKLYRDKFSGKYSQNMVDYLRSDVGIIHKNHAESITTFIKKSVDEEVKDGSDSVKPPQKKRLTFCVEGNISVGKSTFLQRIANETIELQDLVEVVPEPINKWQDIGPEHFNILDAFYAEPQRYAYTFQNYVFVTRVMQEKESSGGIKPLRLMERSVFSDRMVFVRAVHEANWMNEMEISIYDSWFDPVVSTMPGLIPDGFIYLRASPDTCHKRMMIRKRTEEGGVSLDYLRDLHEKHENWLFPFESGNHGILSVSKLPFHLDSSLHPDIRDRVFYLEGDHMHSSIQKVPALVLDCEPNIDFNKDIEAKRQYARQVAEFFEFVKKKSEIPPSKPEHAALSNQRQVLLPHKGLWAPGGTQFPESALKSMNFSRAMSYMSG